MSAPEPKYVRTYDDRENWSMGVLADPRLTAGAKNTGVRLAMHHNAQNGRCDPSMATLAKETAQHPRAVARHVEALAARGHLAWTSTMGRTSNKYRLLMPDRPVDRMTSEAGLDAANPGSPVMDRMTNGAGLAAANHDSPAIDPMSVDPTQPCSTGHTNLLNPEKNLRLETFQARVGERKWRARFAGTTFEDGRLIFRTALARDDALNDHGPLIQEIFGAVKTEIRRAAA